MELAGILFASGKKWSAAAAGLFVLLWVIRVPLVKKHRIKAGILSLLFLSVFLLAMVHTGDVMKQESLLQDNLTEGETVGLVGRTVKIEYKNEQYRYYLEDAWILQTGDGKKMQTPVKAFTVILYRDSDEGKIGDRLYAEGRVSLYEEASNEGQFDVAAFYRSLNIYFTLDPENIEVLSERKLHAADSLYRLRCRLEESLEQTGEEARGLGFFFLTEDRIGIIDSMLLGERGTMEETIKDLYQSAGISHVLAISALHVSLIGMGFYAFLRKRRWGFTAAFLAAGPLVLAYVQMTGNSISARRAAVMLILTMIAAVLGRSRDMLNGLGGICCWLLWENPGLIHYSGFLFSVAAVCGIAVTGKVFEEEEEDGKKPFWQEFKNNLGMSLAISLTTLPLVACYYYEIPLYSVFLNMLILPFMSILLISGLLGAAAGLVWSAGAAFALLPAGIILWGYEILCRLFLKLPWAQVICGKPSAGKMIIYYLLLAAFLLALQYMKQREEEMKIRADHPGRKRPEKEEDLTEDRRLRLQKRQRKIRSGMKAVLTMFCFSLILLQGGRGFELDQLDVGQGDGAFIRTGDGITFFIDGGSTSEDQLAKYRLLPFLKCKGVRKIDYWFVSHGDEDHISGLLEVLESGYRVEHILLAEQMPEDEAKMQILTAAEAAGTEIILLEAGDEICTKTAKIRILYPGTGDDGLFSDRNDLCLSFYYEEAGFSALFAGDLSSEAEILLAERSLLQKVDYLKVCHHGSRYSSCEEFLEALSPAVSVISCGLENTYGHPSEEAVKRITDCGSRIFYTMYSGEVSVTEENGRFCIRTWKQN